MAKLVNTAELISTTIFLWFNLNALKLQPQTSFSIQSINLALTNRFYQSLMIPSMKSMVSMKEKNFELLARTVSMS